MIVEKWGPAMQACAPVFASKLRQATEEASSFPSNTKPFVYVELGVFKGETFSQAVEILEFSNLSGWNAFGVDAEWLDWFNLTGASQKVAKHSFGLIDMGSEDMVPPNKAAFLTCGALAFGLRSTLRPNWIFIDACHCVACSSADIALSARMLLPGGWMAIHDTCLDQQAPFPSAPCERSVGVLEAIKCLGLLNGRFPGMSIVDSVEVAQPQSGLMIFRKSFE
jgi:hypothetical protein